MWTTSSSKPTAQACYSTTYERPRSTQQVRNQAQPEEVRIRRPSRKTTRVQGFRQRNRSKPRKGPRNRQDTRAHRYQRRATAHWKTRSAEPLHQQARRKNLTILPATQERRKI